MNSEKIRNYYRKLWTRYHTRGPGNDEVHRRYSALKVPNTVEKSIVASQNAFKNLSKATTKNRRMSYFYKLADMNIPYEVYTGTINDAISTGELYHEDLEDMLKNFTYPDIMNMDNNNNNNVIDDDNMLNEPDIIEEVADEVNDENLENVRVGSKRKQRFVRGKAAVSRFLTQPYFEGPSNDTQYCDFACIDDVPESGYVWDTILYSPKNLGTGRDSNAIRVYRIEFKGEFKLEFGGSASPRLIVFIDKQPTIHTPLFGTPSVNARQTNEIIVNDILSLRARFESGFEGEIPNIEGNPNCFCFNNFINTKSDLSDSIVPIYEFYRDLNCNAVKDVAGEGIDNIPVKTTFKFTIDDLDIHVRFADDNPETVIMNNISFMWIGDYYGGVITGICYARCYYHSITL